jgi:hypothetical protein
VTDRLEKLEAELKRLRPAPLPGELSSRIEREMSLPAMGSWSDRILLFAMSSGAVAACVIVAIVMSESSALPAAPANLAAISPPPTRAGDATMMFAEADNAWWKRLEMSR